jgi:UTP--glucose-1-phosphate uridylyltransferase
MRVRKAVFPAAGWGTRFLPATKAQPKEMLPLVDKPVIQYAVEEAVAAGIEQVIIVTSSQKRAIEDHFDLSYELEHLLEEKGDIEMLRQVRRISDLAQIAYVRQKEQLGLGHAVLMAKDLIGHEPFAVILPDDVIIADRPCIGQLIHAFGRNSPVTSRFVSSRSSNRSSKERSSARSGRRSSMPSRGRRSPSPESARGRC